MVSRETHGTIVVFGFGHDEIGNVLFVGLHGLNIKKHVQGWQVVPIFLLLLLLLRCGWKLCSRSSFSTRTSLTFPLSLLFLRLGSSLNKTTVSFTVHVLVAGGTFYMLALMLFNLV